MRKMFLAVAVLVLVGFSMFWWLSEPEVIAPANVPDAGNAARGEYVFYMAGCASCHAAPGSDDRLSLAGGMEFVTEFGTFRAPNISPDPDAGIGGWSTPQFVNAVMRGVSPDGEHYYPAFPYSSYQRMKVQDVVDLKAFMDTLPAVAVAAPGHDIPFPFNIRRGLGLWKLIYIDRQPFQPDPDLSEEENRGAYLVEGPGHCNECHTPRDMLGGLDYTRRLSGAANPDGEGRIPNITPDTAHGIGTWSLNEIAFALETGFTPEFDSFGGSMARVVANTSRLTPQDRAAIAAYLKTVPALPDN